MTVEQTLKVLEDMKAMLDERQALHLWNAETHDANAQRMEECDPLFYKNNIAVCRELSAQQRTLAVDCDEKKRHINHAIAIIEAAQAVVDNAVPEDAVPWSSTPIYYYYEVSEEPMRRLISLISPEQEQYGEV